MLLPPRSFVGGRRAISLCLIHLNRSGLRIPMFLLAPPTREGNSTSYCPRYGGQFVVRSGGCPDCRGVGLLAFRTPWNRRRVRYDRLLERSQ